MANKINFKSIATDELSLSPLMSGREQIKTDALAGKEATVIAFDFATITDNGEQKTFPVLLLEEYPKHYYNGGALLSKLCAAWASAYDGDIEMASHDLGESGGVKLKFIKTQTKTGRNLTRVEVVD
jgi:hypothetical protein